MFLENLGSTSAPGAEALGFRPLVVALGGAVTFGLLAWISVELTRGEGRIAVVWLANALAVAFLLRARLPREDIFIAALWAGNLISNLTIGDAPVHAAGLAAANSVEIIIAVVLVRRSCGSQPDMSDLSHLARFVLFAGIVAPLISAACASLILFFEGSLSIATLAGWAASDGLGMILIGPIAMIIAESCTRLRRPTRAETREWLTITLFAISVATLVFAQSSHALLFVIPPVMVLAAFRLGSLGTAIITAQIAIIATLFTWHGTGPINLSDKAMNVKLIELQAFLVCAFVIGLPVAATLNGRRKTMQELAERERQLALLASSITDAVLRYDETGVCNYASQSCQTVLGLPPEKFIGIRAADRVHDQAQESISSVQQKLVSGEVDKHRFTYRRFMDSSDGEPAFIEADCAATFDPDTGERDGIIVCARNVTHRVKLEQDLVSARRHAENAASAKSQFLANMSHEIRTPMNGVLGFAELLHQGDLSDEDRHYAELIVESGRTMMVLLNDILDISKLEAGQIVITEEPVNLDHVLAGCVKLHSANAEQKGVTLRCRTGARLPSHVMCDQLRLRQIMLNLIGNAVKFTHEGSVTISANAVNDNLVLAVDDTGIGIDDERVEQIFNPFEQADGATSRNFGGTGLGLTISRQLADLMGGSLSVESRPSAGSRFSLTLPLKRAEIQTPPIPSVQSFTPTTLPPASQILLVEDHDVNRMLMTAMLERCGQSVSIAVDGNDAIAAVIAAHETGCQFDLVLMDIQMPGCDGYTATRAIRSAGISPDMLGIVALTANAFPEDVQAAHKSGMQAHLAKPIVFDDLLAALSRWLPVKIVDTSRPGGAEALPPAPKSVPLIGGHSESLSEKWLQRRSEAIEAVSDALSSGEFDGEIGDELARTMHKLAGTAGIFGEEDLGEKARNFERALRAGVDREACEKLAEELLEVG